MNNNFDKMIKSMIEHEPNPMSGEFKNLIKSALEKLPEDNTGLKKVQKSTRRIKVLLIASIIALFLMTTAFASVPRLLEMTQNFLKEFYKLDNLNILSKQEEFEKYNAPVGYTSESEGISVTIDNIAVDGNFLLISSTVKCNRPIEDIIKDSWIYNKSLEMKTDDSENIDYKEFLFNIIPRYYMEIDEVNYERLDMSDNEEYLKDEYTFIAVQKYILPTEVPDIFELSISEKYICHTKGDWSFDMTIDKSKTNGSSVTVTPNIKAEVTSIVQGKEYTHSIIIDKLSISPFGGQIAISEGGSEPFRDFALRDENGNYYLVLNDSVKFAENGDISKNVFEFIYPSTNGIVNELEIIPILTNGTPVEKQVMILDYDSPTEIKISDIGGYITESLEVDEKQLKLTLKQHGAILQYRSIINGAFGLLDKTGSKNINKYINLNGVKYDKHNGNAVITGYWSNDAPDNIQNQIGGFWYVEMPNMLLNEDEAIKIPLNK